MHNQEIESLLSHTQQVHGTQLLYFKDQSFWWIYTVDLKLFNATNNY